MDIVSYIPGLPLNEQKIVTYLRNILFDCYPAWVEKLSYGVPYYFRHRRVCFIWPASVPNGPAGDSTAFGFCQGNRLSNSHGLLTSKGRKQVYTMDCSTLTEINETVLRETILEALLFDDTFNKKYGRTA